MEEEPEEMPRLSYDLIKFLDANVPSPHLNSTPEAAGGLDPKECRHLAFTMGMRAVVDDLVAEMNRETRGRLDEDERDRQDWQAKVDGSIGTPNGSWSGLERILGSDGEFRTGPRGRGMDVEPHERVLDHGSVGREIPDSSDLVPLGPFDDD